MNLSITQHFYLLTISPVLLVGVLDEGDVGQGDFSNTLNQMEPTARLVPEIFTQSCQGVLD